MFLPFTPIMLANRHISWMITAVLISCAGSFLWQSAGFYQALHNFAPAPQKEVPAIVADARQAPLDLDTINAVGWFGSSTDQKSASTPPAPASLKLKGISHSPDHPDLAGAYISLHDGPETFFQIGDALPENNGMLAAIFEDHVTVRAGNKDTTLRFPATEN